MDELDIADAQATATLERELAAQKARAASEPKLTANGICHSPRCGEEFAPGDARLFCGPSCATDHARMTR